MYPLRQLLADVHSSWIMKSFEVSEIFFQRSVALFKIEKEPNRTSRTFYLFRPSWDSDPEFQIPDPRSQILSMCRSRSSNIMQIKSPSSISDLEKNCYCMTAWASTSANVDNQSTTLLRSFLYFAAFRVP